MKIRDRVVGLKRITARELRANPKNWRTHPAPQRKALEGLLKEIGFAGAELARQMPDGKYELIDGHLRAEIADDAKIPVLVLDLNDAEADKLLALFDPLGAMAKTDGEQHKLILEAISSEDDAVSTLISSLLATAESTIGDAVEDANAEWNGMPEFDQKDKMAWRSIIVHFNDQAAIDAFAKLVEQTLTDKTRFIWYPKVENAKLVDKAYADEDDSLF